MDENKVRPLRDFPPDDADHLGGDPWMRFIIGIALLLILRMV